PAFNRKPFHRSPGNGHARSLTRPALYRDTAIGQRSQLTYYPETDTMPLCSDTGCGSQTGDGFPAHATAVVGDGHHHPRLHTIPLPRHAHPHTTPLLAHRLR